MAKQIKLSNHTADVNELSQIGRILDLERKYFNLLWDLFSSEDFKKDLKIIESEIQKQYNFLNDHWELKNKLKIPAERLVRQYIYKEYANKISKIYPSPVSCDIAFVTEDAIVQIDVKTLDVIGNKGDIKKLQFENNQSSFVNKNLDVDVSKPNSGVRVECLLPKEYSYDNNEALPVLTFFFTVVYCDNGKSFKLNNEDTLQTIYLKCLPNGYLSPLFDYDIVENFKTYTYFDKKHGLERIKLTDDKTQINKEVKNHISTNPSDFILINGRTKIGAFQPDVIHPKYKTKGISWFPVERKDGIYLEAVNKGHTNRVNNETLNERYDSKDQLWYGIKKEKIE